MLFGHLRDRLAKSQTEIVTYMWDTYYGLQEPSEKNSRRVSDRGLREQPSSQGRVGLQRCRLVSFIHDTQVHIVGENSRNNEWV